MAIVGTVSKPREREKHELGGKFESRDLDGFFSWLVQPGCASIHSRCRRHNGVFVRMYIDMAFK